jgi:hypothetical protein
MGIDVNRIRMNTKLSDPDAVRYYREVAPPPVQPSTASLRKSPGMLKRLVNRRPLVVVGFCMTAGISVGYALIKYRESPANGEIVYQTIDKIREEFNAYEQSLRRS